MGPNPTKLESIPQQKSGRPTKKSLGGMNGCDVYQCVYIYILDDFMYQRDEHTHGKQTWNQKSWRFGEWFSCSTEWSLRAPSSSLHSASSSSMNYHYAEWVPHSPLRKTDMQIISFLFGPSKHPTKCKNIVVSCCFSGMIPNHYKRNTKPPLKEKGCLKFQVCVCFFFWNFPRCSQLRHFGRFMTIIHIHPRKYKSIWAPTNCK